MSVTNILASIEARAPWRAVARNMIKQAGLHVGGGWGDTLSALRQPNAIDQSATDSLYESLIEHVAVGEKLLQFFELNPTQLRRLVDHFTKQPAQMDPIAKHYPWMVKESALVKYQDVAGKFCEVVDLAEGTAIIFAGVRSYSKRVPILKTDLKASYLANHDVDSIYGIVNKRQIVYDSIWVPRKSRFVVAAVDYPSDATIDFPTLSRLSVQSEIAKAVGAAVDPVDLFKAVSGLHGAPSGDLVELGFVTDADSVKHLKGRKKGRSLWNDEYHIAGSEEVGPSLSPYRVALRWSRQETPEIVTSPELQLLGTSRHIFGVKVPLESAVFRNGLNSRDLELVLSKLEPHI